MTTGELSDFLIAEIEATGDRSFAQTLLDLAREKILAGAGQVAPISSGSLNGKNFQRFMRLDAVQVAAACRAALDYTDPDDQKGVSCSRLDFSNL